MLLVDYNLGFNVTFSGVFIVFMMLVFLVYVLSIFGLISKIGLKRQEKRNKALNAKEVQETKESVSTEIKSETSEQINPEIVAVISAAVASMYFGSSKKPVIKAVKRSGATMSAWASAGVRNNTRAF